jgi:hypothetical protein
VIAWLNTLNNNSLWNSGMVAAEYEKERCWQPKKGLQVWDVNRQGIPKANSSGIYEGIDVVLITASALQIDPVSCWVNQTKWHTILADEGHDYLRGQHNARPGSQSLTLRNWYTLQRRTKSMFIITGTPFVTKISYDVVAITKAVAHEEIRRCWGVEYTDAGLEALVRGWRSELSTMDPSFQRQQAKIRDTVKDKLGLFMIRRDENSLIRGKHVMTDYFKLCTVYEEPLKPTDDGKEAMYREGLYRKSFHNSESITKTRNDNMRCLCWSYRFIAWHKITNRERAVFWRDFTLEEAQRQIRTRELIKILKQAKRTHNGIILFVQRTFLAELCIRVSPPS